MRPAGRWEDSNDYDYDYDESQSSGDGIGFLIFLAFIPVWMLLFAILDKTKIKNNAGLISCVLTFALIYFLKEYFLLVGIVAFLILKKID